MRIVVVGASGNVGTSTLRALGGTPEVEEVQADRANSRTLPPFFLVDRYRMPLVPALALFAAAGGFAVIDLVRRREMRALGAACVVLGALWKS